SLLEWSARKVPERRCFEHQQLAGNFRAAKEHESPARKRRAQWLATHRMRAESDLTSGAAFGKEGRAGDRIGRRGTMNNRYDNPRSEVPPGQARGTDCAFATTHWSVVL